MSKSGAIVGVFGLIFIAGCESSVGETCGGIAGLGCGIGEFCRFETATCGAGDQSGICAQIPGACTLEFDPVCGCDGVTYSNECTAFAAGVSVMHAGRCPGESCTGDFDCSENQYCGFSVGACGGDGSCADMPEQCTEQEDPVCGCDGETYRNACLAAMAGISIKSETPCEQEPCCDPGEEPGVGDNPACFEGASCCADGAWTCNDGSGMSTCAAPGELCPAESCTDGDACDQGEYCLFEVGDCGSGAGVCDQLPAICTEEFDPVCGCDGETYSNDCFAAMAGVSVAHAGECTG